MRLRWRKLKHRNLILYLCKILKIIWDSAMPKQTKDQKRKAKLEKRRKAGERQLQQQTEMLIRMLTELCAPLLPEYTDDS